jgi:hypothetical protein
MSENSLSRSLGMCLFLSLRVKRSYSSCGNTPISSVRVLAMLAIAARMALAMSSFSGRLSR